MEFEEIRGIIESRRRANSPMIQEMIRVRERYNGDYVVPLPSSEAFPEMPPLTPSIVADAIDHTAMRAASVMPYLSAVALDPNKEKGVRSLEYAGIRRKGIAATYYKSNMRMLMRRSFRHICGYATCSFMVMPDFKLEMPRIVVRDPLTTYPEVKAAEDITPPANVGFVYGKSADWIAKNYPHAAKTVRSGRHGGADDLWDCVEWVDEDDIVIGLLGPRSTSLYGDQHMGASMELARWKNRAGMCPVVVPYRVTMDKVASQVANIVGHTDLMAMLTALDILATIKSIYPDRYIIGRSGQMPTIVGGKWNDGASGQPNILLDVEDIGNLPNTPDPNNKIVQDRVERNARVSAGLVPQFGGETYGALRTGKGIDSLMGAAVDPRIQELQELMESVLPALNEGIFSVYEGYWPTKKYVLFSGWPSDRGHVEFEPNVHFKETHETVASYAIAGADIQGTTVALGQLRGLKGISQHTLRIKHPWVEDPEGEEKKILEEDLLEATQVALLNRAAQGGVPPEDMAHIQDYVRQGFDMIDAVLMAQRDAQERQATMAPPPGPGQIAAPEEMAGLANAGMEGQEQPPAELPPDIQPPSPSQQNLRQTLLALRAGSNLRDSARG